MGLKFRNPGEQVVRVAMLTGHIAVFEPGETLEVPEVMKSECLAKNLTEIKDVAEKPLTAAQKKALKAAADEDGDSTVNVADAQ